MEVLRLHLLYISDKKVEKKKSKSPAAICRESPLEPSTHQVTMDDVTVIVVRKHHQKYSEH